MRFILALLVTLAISSAGQASIVTKHGDIELILTGDPNINQSVDLQITVTSDVDVADCDIDLILPFGGHSR